MSDTYRRPRTAVSNDRARTSLLPSEVNRRGPAMMNQQCWCWGCDIRRPEGNLLQHYGFGKQRVPVGEQGSSMYTIHLDHRCISLWGFGLWYGDVELDGGVFISRTNWQPCLVVGSVPTGHIWSWKQITTADASGEDGERLIGLLAGALDWLAEYEEWVARTAGLPYRQQCLQAWRKRTLEAEQLAPTWRRLARQCFTRRRSAHEQPTR